MPEHNAAESRSHLSAWALVSAPLALGFDLTDDAKMDAAWPIISNEEVLAISQTWISGAKFATGQLLKRWQAKNVPTLEVRGSCSSDARWCVDSNPKCAEWAKDDQCEANPNYMLRNCRKSCATCQAGNFTGWTFSGASGEPGRLSLGTQCVDAAGQLPVGHGGVPNVLHTAPCDATKPSQMFRLNGTIVTIDGRLCLRVSSTWLWAQPVVNLAACETPSGTPPRADSEWTLHANGTLQNTAKGCVALSADSGPPSTIWAKPLSGGRMALLAINGADLTQMIALDFAELLRDEQQPTFDAAEEAVSWHVRDVWTKTDLGKMGKLTRNVPPHDCVLLVLTPIAN